MNEISLFRRNGGESQEHDEPQSVVNRTANQTAASSRVTAKLKSGAPWSEVGMRRRIIEAAQRLMTKAALKGKAGLSQKPSIPRQRSPRQRQLHRPAPRGAVDQAGTRADC
jgi:hypothetical protein